MVEGLKRGEGCGIYDIRYTIWGKTGSLSADFAEFLPGHGNYSTQNQKHVISQDWRVFMIMRD
jgi:hypothetical protein